MKEKKLGSPVLQKTGCLMRMAICLPVLMAVPYEEALLLLRTVKQRTTQHASKPAPGLTNTNDHTHPSVHAGLPDLLHDVPRLPSENASTERAACSPTHSRRCHLYTRLTVSLDYLPSASPERGEGTEQLCGRRLRRIADGFVTDHEHRQAAYSVSI